MSKLNNYYSRQIILDEVGLQGQEKLFNAKVLVIGAGGLGSPLLTYLVSAGVGSIVIYDFDKVEETNLHRQTLFSPLDIGKNKASAAKEILRKKNPLIQIEAKSIAFNSETLVEDIDIVIDCSDNFKSKFSAHDLSYKNGKIFCVASIHKFEGQVQLFDFSKNIDNCMRCLWEQMPSNDCIQTCAEAGVIGATAGIIGTIQAMEVIKCILGLNHIKNNQNLIINLLDFQSFKLKISKNDQCPLCGSSTIKPSILPEKRFSEINNGKYLFINIGDKGRKLKFDIQSNLEEIQTDTQSLEKKTPIAIFCNRGVTSLKAAQKLQKLGFSNTFSVKDGVSSINCQ